MPEKLSKNHPARWLGLGLLWLLLALISGRAALACSCVPPGPPQAEFERAQAVFAGWVVERQGPQGGFQSSAEPVSYLFQVEQTWKGPNQSQIVVASPASSASCGYEFEFNRQYLVYAFKGEDGLSTNLCSRTRPVVEAEEDLAFLGAGSLPTPGMGQTPGPDLPPAGPFPARTLGLILWVVFTGLLGIVIILGLILIIQRRRKS